MPWVGRFFAVVGYTLRENWFAIVWKVGVSMGLTLVGVLLVLLGILLHSGL